MKDREAAIAFIKQECQRILTLRRRYREFTSQYAIDKETVAQEKIVVEAKNRYIQSIEGFGKRISYQLPSFLISFPRSGSNFVQHVVEGSSGYHCRSIYSRQASDAAGMLMYKSHALSPTYLFDEADRLLGTSVMQTRTICLYRDPRDVMISFLEYARHQKNIKIEQSGFLHDYDFFYVSRLDPECLRKQICGTLNIMEAYSMHVSNWLAPQVRKPEILYVRYEDLLEEPAVQFARIFRHLELDCHLQGSLLDDKVSTFSNEPRARGHAYGWKRNADKYGVLIEQINEELSGEIELLGYEIVRK